METEIIINVPEIEPRMKHQTIFQTFNKLKPGESMVIHNDHDPKPVYYQLQGIYGDVFTWEYLQAGPEWWDIRVTRKEIQKVEIDAQEGELIIDVQRIEPRMRHQTIFNEFDKLNEGESLIIHNNHDPKPVYFQLLELRGEVFTWDYLQEGPEWWDIRVRKRTDLSGDNNQGTDLEAIVINVQEIEPRMRHQTIFKEFDKLNEGESLIIHNNHDPRPVYFQLQQLRGDSFDWEYLEAGPEWWDVLVTKRPAEAPQGISYTHQGEIVITVPEIEPRLKHETIFDTYENLKMGESMIIHNDHDPKPVYYQLRSMHGEAFEWEYLQQGPEWWDVRVSKKPEESTWEEQVAHALTRNESNDIVINIPSLQPRLKHPTIFKVFESLEGGESLVIHNDHDPKPVYYQLLGEYGDIFNWNYLQEGPEWWDIRVTKRSPDDTETIGEISAKDLRKAEVFKKFGIDFSCSGNKTLKEVCDEKGIDADQVEKELNQPEENTTANKVNYADWPIDFLTDYVVNMHHNYIKKYSGEIQQYATKVAQVHGEQHPELHPLQEKVEEVMILINQHIEEEEFNTFPMVKKIFNAKAKQMSLTPGERSSFEAWTKKLGEEHQDFLSAFKTCRELTHDYAIPEDACTSYKLLFQLLQDFESDLQTHLHIENNILFPKTAEIVKELV